MRCNLFQTSILLLLLAATVLSVQASEGRRGLLPGGWQPIKDIKDPAIQEIAKFAVDQNNLKAKASLTFVAVKSGEFQVVSGINYRLIISASAGAATGDYQAVVWEHADHSKELVSFAPASA